MMYMLNKSNVVIGVDFNCNRFVTLLPSDLFKFDEVKIAFDPILDIDGQPVYAADLSITANNKTAQFTITMAGCKLNEGRFVFDFQQRDRATYAVITSFYTPNESSMFCKGDKLEFDLSQSSYLKLYGVLSGNRRVSGWDERISEREVDDICCLLARIQENVVVEYSGIAGEIWLDRSDSGDPVANISLQNLNEKDGKSNIEFCQREVGVESNVPCKIGKGSEIVV